MALFSFRKGFRWSLYICKHGKEWPRDYQMEYVLHTSNLHATLVHLTDRYRITQPTYPWTFWLNLNRKHSHDRRDHAFQLLRHHLASGKATDAFYRDLEDIDPDWRGHQASNATEVLRDKGGNEIPIWPDYIENPMNTIEEIENYVNRTRSPEEETLQEIMDRIFR